MAKKARFRHWPFSCEIKGMTQIVAASRASLAQEYSKFSREKREKLSFEREASQAGETHSRGNRRMGDRRGADRRTSGRRASDQHHRQEASSWCSAQFGAHLLGQVEAAPSVTQQQVRSAYRKPFGAMRARGDVA